MDPEHSVGTELSGNTLRQFVYVSIGRSQLRVQISNRFGMVPLLFCPFLLLRLEMEFRKLNRVQR